MVERSHCLSRPILELNMCTTCAGNLSLRSKKKKANVNAPMVGGFCGCQFVGVWSWPGKVALINSLSDAKQRVIALRWIVEILWDEISMFVAQTLDEVLFFRRMRHYLFTEYVVIYDWFRSFVIYVRNTFNVTFFALSVSLFNQSSPCYVFFHVWKINSCLFCT